MTYFELFIFLFEVLVFVPVRVLDVLLPVDGPVQHGHVVDPGPVVRLVGGAADHAKKLKKNI